MWLPHRLLPLMEIVFYVIIQPLYQQERIKESMCESFFQVATINWLEQIMKCSTFKKAKVVGE